MEVFPSPFPNKVKKRGKCKVGQPSPFLLRCQNKTLREKRSELCRHPRALLCRHIRRKVGGAKGREIPSLSSRLWETNLLSLCSFLHLALSQLGLLFNPNHMHTGWILYSHLWQKKCSSAFDKTRYFSSGSAQTCRTKKWSVSKEKKKTRFCWRQLVCMWYRR